jgi:hypothetical protein
MECRKYESQFNDYLDGELSLKERETLQSHLRKCLSCYRKWNSLQKTKEILGRLPNLHPPSHLSAVVMARLKERRLPRLTGPFAYLPRWLPLGVGATLVLIISLTLWQVMLPSFSLRSLLSGQDNTLTISGNSSQPTAKSTTTREGTQTPVPVMVLRVKDFSRADRELESMLRSISGQMVQEREPTRPLNSSSARLIDVRVPEQRFSHLLRELHKIGHLDQSQVEIRRLANPQKQKAISLRIVVVGNGSDVEIHQLGE